MFVNISNKEEHSMIRGTKDETPSNTTCTQNCVKQAEIINRVQNDVCKTEKKMCKGQKTCHCIQCGKSFTRRSSLIVHLRVHTGEKRFMCTQCGKRFSLKSSMVRHLRIHIPKPVNICPDCGMCFTRYYGLLQHQKIHNRGRQYRCRDCGKSFLKISELVVHQWIHERNGQGENGSDGQGQVTILHNGEEANVCLESGRSFRKNSSFIRNQRRQKVQPLVPAVSVYGPTNGSSDDQKSGTNPFAQRVKTERSLQLEAETSQSERKVTRIKRRFLCAECGKSFTRKSSLIVHQRVHTGEKRFMCTQCGKRFGLKSSMVRHMRTYCPKSLNICPDCGKCFSCYTSLFQHQKVHRRKTKFKCSQGERSFSGASQLAAYQRTHTALWTFPETSFGVGSHNGNKPTNNLEESHIAPLCGKSLQEQSMLQTQQGESFIGTTLDSRTCSSVYENGQKVSQHEDTCSNFQLNVVANNSTSNCDKRDRKVSSVKKNFPCPECGKSFTRKSSLIVHQRVHTGEKRFMCTQCGKRFSLKSSLVRHLRIHVPKTTNICPDCGKYFTRYSSLLKHQKIHRKVKAYKCSQSEKSICLTSQLAVHLKTHKAKEFDLKAEDEGNHNVVNSRELHVCLQCGQQFGQQDLLNRHQREHTGVSKTVQGVRLATGGCLISLPESTEQGHVAPEPVAASGTSLGSMMHEGNQENTDFHGCNTKDNFKTVSEESNCTHLTSWNTRGIHSNEASQGGVERGSCTKAIKQNQKERSSCSEKPYHCIECGKYFTRKSSLIVHQRIHTGEKLYMCTECGRRFSLKCSLVRHMRTHSGQPFNICSQCGLYFSCYQDLSVHMESHKNELVLNHEAFPKTEPDGQQWLPDMKIPPDAYITAVTVPALNKPESALLDRTQRSHNNPSLLPEAPVRDSMALSHPNTWNETQSDSLNIKEKILENTPGELLLNHNAVLKIEPDGQRWLPNMKISPDAYNISHNNPSLLPEAPVSDSMALSHPNTRKETQSDSVKIKEEILENTCLDELPLNQDAFLKTEPNERQWLPNMSSPDADITAVTVLSLKEPESALILDGAQRSQHNPFLLPGAPVSDSVALSHANTWDKIQSDSLNIKKEILENTCPAGEHQENHAYQHSLNCGVDFDIAKALNKDISVKMGKISVPLDKFTLTHAANGLLGVSMWDHGLDEDNRAQSGRKCFLCAECGKSFTRKSSLIVHQRVHTGEKRFMCTQCGKRFGLKSSMVRHMRTHSSELFTCR